MDYDPRETDAFLDELEVQQAPRGKREPPKRGPPSPAVPAGFTKSMTPEQVEGSVVTYDDMRKALSKLLKRRGMDEEEVNHLAMYLLSFFGFSDAIIDNILDTEDRDVFYMLEEEGILSTSREETYTIKGKVWRIHYWVLKKREILRLSSEVDAESGKAQAPAEFAVYDEVDPRVWTHED